MHVVIKKLGFTSQAATENMEEQGIDNLEELKVFNDEIVKSLWKLVRKSWEATGTGGTVVS